MKISTKIFKTVEERTRKFNINGTLLLFRSIKYHILSQNSLNSQSHFDSRIQKNWVDSAIVNVARYSYCLLQM